MNVFRLHIRPGGGLADANVSFAYCLDRQVLGVGWQAYTDAKISTWEEYEATATQHHDDLSRVRFLKNRVKENDLIWTRCPLGNYHLARVFSEWEYLTCKEAEDADIVNVVRCEIRRVPRIDQVPGKVVACFRPTRTIQSIANEHVQRYSTWLWNQLSASDHYPLPAAEESGIFSYLGAEETEDIVFLYLQMQGWLVVPHTRKADSMRFEFSCIHRETKRRAVVQVKTGNTWLNPDDWTGLSEHVFLFQSNGLYSGSASPGVDLLTPSEMEAFMTEHREILPAAICYWLDISSAAMEQSHPSVPR